MVIVVEKGKREKETASVDIIVHGFRNKSIDSSEANTVLQVPTMSSSRHRRHRHHHHQQQQQQLISRNSIKKRNYHRKVTIEFLFAWF